MSSSEASHLPVLLTEVLEAMQPQDGEVYVDATFGAGGYSRALLNAAKCTVYAIDRDPSVHPFAEKLQQEFEGRFCFLLGCFSEMIALLAAQGIHQVQGIVMDIGVSSMQIDQPERGFSFMREGPLDMRQSLSGISAADVVNTLPETELADIFYRYGEEKKSRYIARAIVTRRAEKPFETTTDLAAVIAEAVYGKHDIHPATRSFQALRIYINRELEELEASLEATKALLAPGGRLVVVSFHSLEDRIVKQFLRRESGNDNAVSRHLPVPIALRALGGLPPQTPAASRRPLGGESFSAQNTDSCHYTLSKKSAITGSEAEIKRNPRARSAKLRWAIRTSHKAA
jgi:16S rRNA (cytosine1402-N4)-methyltransferase